MTSVQASPLLYPILVHIGWIVALYGGLTVVRAPDAWGIGGKPDGTNPFAAVEPRIAANLRNQFEWPLVFYVVSILLIVGGSSDPIQLWLAWLFVIGRVLHSGVHIALNNIRLRGLVFTINFVAVLAMWGVFVT